MSASSARIVLVVNGPGELAGWAEPLAAAIKNLAPSSLVGIAIVPCVYSAGTERRVASNYGTVDVVSSAAETMRWVVKGTRPPGFGNGELTTVLHLGGDPFLTLALCRRTGARSGAYLEGPLTGSRWFQDLYARDEVVRRRVHERAAVVGDLMVDAARSRCPERRPPHAGEPPVIGIFPGSRRQYYRYMLPFFMLVAARARARLPGARWLIARAPFVSNADLASAAGSVDSAALGGDTATFSTIGDGPDGRLESRSGLLFDICATGDVMARATVVLTLPGTSTAELAALGIPMVACAPTYKLDEVPLPGPLGHLDRVPWFGRTIKHAAVYLYGRRIRYLAHPNRRTGRWVVPEALGRITPEQVADLLVPLATTRPVELEEELRRIMGPPGAALRLARALLES